jgi:hypothetical protein
MSVAVKGTKGFVSTDTAEARFWAKVDKTPRPGGCWLWTGSRGHGYGQFYVSPQRPRVRAHRYAWELHTGKEMPAELDGCHRCDNPSCVNPEHIFAGTKRENALDAVTKGRVIPPGLRGLPNHNSLKTHCPRGHPLSGDNVRIRPTGHRACRACHRIVNRAYETRAALSPKADGEGT